jgi:hypothetical protein
MLVDDNGLATPAGAGIEVTVAETGATDLTDGKGFFHIQLANAIQPGSPITLNVAKLGWAVWQPRLGLEIRIFPGGSQSLNRKMGGRGGKGHARFL